MKNKKKIIKYILFAIFATIANLLTQRIILSFFQTTFFLLAIFLGTLVGLIIKFFLDKTFIFFDKSKISKKLGKSLVFILQMGFFQQLFLGNRVYILDNLENRKHEEIGAVIGLSIGYIIKYKLDKKYVFNKQ